MNQVKVHIVDDDETFAVSQKFLLQLEGIDADVHTDPQKFVRRPPHGAGCILLDVRMPKMTGLEVQVELQKKGCTLPVVFLTGHGDIEMAVHAVQRGAMDFLVKPVEAAKLIETVRRACDKSILIAKEQAELSSLQALYETLTAREREVLDQAAMDTPNKIIARILDIGEATVKMHRANAFAKIGVKSPLEAYRFLEKLGRRPKE